MLIRPTGPADAEALADVHRTAFGSEVEPALALALMADDAFMPDLSFVAEEDGRLLGHVLVTRAWLRPKDGSAELPLLLLAPLAVVPDAQRQGIGTMLVEAAATLAAETGEIAMVVLGHPEYYPRFGFEPAVPRGIRPPYPVEPEAAWMMLEFGGRLPAGATGVLRVAEPLDAPELWQE